MNSKTPAADASPGFDAGFDAGLDDFPAGQASSLRANLYALQEALRSALGSIRAHALRSFLTMLGIIIGVASVIAVVALVQGLSTSISRQFQSLGGNALTVRAETPLEDELRGKINRLRLTDVDQIRHGVDGINHITPIVAGGGGVEIRSGSNVGSAIMLGTTSRYQDVQQTYPRYGRFLTDSDDATRRRVVVIGERLRRDLKLPADPTNHYIQVGSEWFKVVGLMEPRGEMFGVSQDNYLLMPYNTALSIKGVADQPDLSITFTVIDLDQASAVKAKVTNLLRRLHQIKPKQADDFAVESADSLAKSFKEISTIVTLVVAGVVGISLLVGGVGIMNIMLVSVTERTREIGIVKALGAPRHFILMQFLMEAVVLAMLGGLIGVAIGYGLGFGIAKLIPNFPDPSVPWWAIFGACGFSGLVGMAFGIIPASNAAGLAPIEALRYE